MSDDLLARVRAIVATLFDVPVEQVQPESGPQQLERWDSMGHLTLVLQLEQEFGVALPPEVVEKICDVRGAADAVRSVQHQ